MDTERTLKRMVIMLLALWVILWAILTVLSPG